MFNKDRPRHDVADKTLPKLVLCLAMGCCVVCSGKLYAVTGIQLSLPAFPRGTTAYSKQSGLRITVDTTWLGGRGYRPVQVTLSSAKPVLGDIQITVSFHASFWSTKHRSITVEKDIELRQGTSSATAILLVPQYFDWSICGWQVWIDGKKDDELSLDYTGLRAPNRSNAQRAALVLRDKPFLVSGQPRVAEVTKYLDDFGSEIYDAISINSRELPEKWPSYASLDVVIATPGSLQQWNESSSSRFRELLRWVRAGGNLWIFDVGSDYSKLVEVESSLDMRPEEQDSPSFEDRGWQYLPLHDQPQQGADALVILQGQSKTENALSPSADGLSETQPSGLADDSRDWFVARAYGMGTVVAFCGSPGGERAAEAAAAVRRSLLEERLDWETRHGNDPGLGNLNFADQLIPDVGIAPVFVFQLLISLFVLGIGPLNYWLLKRRHQLPMLLVTVPTAALAATLLLLGYGLWADGFDVRVRARSITLLDQKAGEAVCWARLSYYAGLAPSDGLKIPDDTAIYPILPWRVGSGRFSRQYDLAQREMEWDKQQHLTRGWLGSRTPTQYLAITARASEKKIVFKRQADTFSATNQLGVAVLTLAVQDHDGNFYLGERIDAGSSMRLERSDHIAAMMRLRPIFSENILEFPVGFVDPRRSSRSWRGRQVLGVASLPKNLMEAQIQSILSPLADGWGNGTYIAITAAGPEVSLGIEDAIESASFHVVRGTWTYD